MNTAGMPATGVAADRPCAPRQATRKFATNQTARDERHAGDGRGSKRYANADACSSSTEFGLHGDIGNGSQLALRYRERLQGACRIWLPDSFAAYQRPKVYLSLSAPMSLPKYLVAQVTEISPLHFPVWVLTRRDTFSRTQRNLLNYSPDYSLSRLKQFCFTLKQRRKMEPKVVQFTDHA